MWIIPKCDTFRSAPGTTGSGLDCNSCGPVFERSLMWRSKPSLARTWSQRWKRVPWLRALSGRICDPSRSIDFVAWWMFSLRASHVSRSPMPEVARGWTTSDTSGRSSQTESEPADLFSSSSRTLTASSPRSADAITPFSTMSSASWKRWVIERRRNASRRQKSAHRIDAGDGSSSGWSTPSAWEQGGTPEQFRARQKKWEGKYHNHPPLDVQVRMQADGIDWRTSRHGRAGQNLNSTTGNRHARLNPDWVETLMGLPPGWTDFACSETAWCRSSAPEPSPHSLVN